MHHSSRANSQTRELMKNCLFVLSKSILLQQTMNINKTVQDLVDINKVLDSSVVTSLLVSSVISPLSLTEEEAGV